jgi:hypothetical protein
MELAVLASWCSRLPCRLSVVFPAGYVDRRDGAAAF